MLRAEFDASGDGVVSADEFLSTFQALALRQPLDGFRSVPADHAACAQLLSRSTNRALLNLGKALYDSMLRS